MHPRLALEHDLARRVDPLPDRAPGPGTGRLCLFTVQVPAVPDLHVREALWTVVQAVREVDA